MYPSHDWSRQIVHVHRSAGTRWLLDHILAETLVSSHVLGFRQSPSDVSLQNVIQHLCIHFVSVVCMVDKFRLFVINEIILLSVTVILLSSWLKHWNIAFKSLLMMIAMSKLSCTAQKFRGCFTVKEMFLPWKTMLTTNVNRKLTETVTLYYLWLCHPVTEH